MDDALSDCSSDRRGRTGWRGKARFLPGAIAIAIAVSPLTSHAAAVIGTRGGWEVFQDTKSCGMTRVYEGAGETEMMVIKYADDTIRIMITNKGWSAKQGKQYDISYLLNGTSYGGAKAVGTGDPVRKGFVSTFVAGFAEDFTKGSTLQVMLADTVIERLSLSGTGVAMALVDQCLTGVRAALTATERENAERADLPRDPFASAPRTPAQKGK